MQKKPKPLLRTIVLPVATAPRGLSPRELLTWRRDQALYATFDYLHHRQRIRYDDTIEQLEALFFLAERSVIELLRTRPAPVAEPIQGGLFS